MSRTAAQVTQLRNVLNFGRENKYSSVYHALSEPPVAPGEFSAYWQTLPKTSHDTWQSYSPFALMHYPESECRFIMSRFTDVPDFFMVPQKIGGGWPLLEDILRTTKSRAVATLLPPHWQLAPMIYESTRTMSTPVAVLRESNLPLAMTVLREAAADLIVTTPAIATALWSEFQKLSPALVPQAWLLVVPFGTAAAAPLSLPGVVHFEQHVFPGVPVAAQALVDGIMTPLYEYPDFLIEKDDRGLALTVSSLSPHAFPLVRYQP